MPVHDAGNKRRTMPKQTPRQTSEIWLQADHFELLHGVRGVKGVDAVLDRAVLGLFVRGEVHARVEAVLLCGANSSNSTSKRNMVSRNQTAQRARRGTQRAHGTLRGRRHCVHEPKRRHTVKADSPLRRRRESFQSQRPRRTGAPGSRHSLRKVKETNIGVSEPA